MKTSGSRIANWLNKGFNLMKPKTQRKRRIETRKFGVAYCSVKPVTDGAAKGYQK